MTTSAPDHTLAALAIGPGDRVAGKYVVERVIGSGGMSVVVVALQEQLGRRVAIKFLAVEEDLQAQAKSRFLREARAAASLRSEHVARVIDADVDEKGRQYIVMEFLEGADLAVRLAKSGGFAVTDVVGYVLQVCEGLAEAHAAGIIHRDLKPENLFLTERVDGSPLVKILDFGISKFVDSKRVANDSSLSNRNALLGTPFYMSPEQLRTPWAVDARCDVWALGVILFELLAGVRPFRGESLPDIMASILTDPTPSVLAHRDDVPAALDSALMACLDKDPDQRLPGVGALARALAPWAPAWSHDATSRVARLTERAVTAGALTPAAQSSPPRASMTPKPTAGLPSSRSAEQGEPEGAEAPRPKLALGFGRRSFTMMVSFSVAALLVLAAWGVAQRGKSKPAPAPHPATPSPVTGVDAAVSSLAPPPTATTESARSDAAASEPALDVAKSKRPKRPEARRRGGVPDTAPASSRLAVPAVPVPGPGSVPPPLPSRPAPDPLEGRR